MTIKKHTITLPRNALRDLMVLPAGCLAFWFAPGALAAITPQQLASPLTEWDVVVQSSDFDASGDQRGFLRANLDLVGNADHPLLASLYDDGGTPEISEDDEFALRVRLGGGRGNTTFDGNLWLGMDVDSDGDLDALLNFTGNGAGGMRFDGEIAVYALGNGANNAPANVSAQGRTPLVALDSRSDDFAFIPVSAESDPGGTNTDLNGDGAADRFLSFKIAWADLAPAVNELSLTGQRDASIGDLNGGTGLTPDSPIQWVVMTSAIGNALAGDVAGYNDRLDNLAMSFTAQNAFLQAVSFSNLRPNIVSDGGADVAMISVQERSTLVTRVQATDPNDDSLSYRISGGADADTFSVESVTGAVSFNAPPRLGNPTDSDGNNRYEVEVTVSDGQGGTDRQLLVVSVIESDVQLDIQNSELSASAETLPADGRSTAVLTVRLRQEAGDDDENGAPFPFGGDDVVITSTLGTVDAVVDNNNGTYTAVYTAGIQAGTATVSASVNGVTLPDMLELELLATEPEPSLTEIEMTDRDLVADGASSSAVTIRLRDANGNPVPAASNEVTLQAELGSVGPVTVDPAGAFTAIYTAPATIGAAEATDTLQALVNGERAVGATISLTLDLLLDADGDGISNGEEGLISDADMDGLPDFLDGDDDGDGIPTQNEGSADSDADGLPNYLDTDSDADGVADGEEGTGDSDADGVPDYLDRLPVLDLSGSEISASVATLAADEQATAQIVVQLLNDEGEPLATVQPVSLMASLGEVGEVLSSGDGRYTATYTAANTAGVAVITASVNGTRIDATAQIELVPVPVDPAQTELILTDEELVANGNSTTTITVSLKDVNGNPVGVGDNEVLVQADLGAITGVALRPDGSLSATYTAPSNISGENATATVQVRVNGVSAGAASIVLLANPEGDTDGDGISNTDEGTDIDTDGDGIVNASDPDDDGDGIDTLEEGTEDTDQDGLPNYLDEDSDNDGFPDSEEGTGDADGDGLPDYLDEIDGNATDDIDLDRDGIPNRLEAPGDLDDDGLINAADVDSDNDGLPDALEAGLAGLDSDGDGLDDALDVDITGGVDSDGDGIDDAFKLPDTDGDNLFDAYDQDSDNDGLSDNVESGVTNMDQDDDGIDNLFDIDFTGGTDLNGDGVDDGVRPVDTDADGVIDALDLDSDNDSLLDVTEEGLPDTDGNGLVDDDTLVDVLRDSDGDETVDVRDLDSDGDEIFDIASGPWAPADADEDGQVDSPVDGDGDGIADAVDGAPEIWGNAPAQPGVGKPGVAKPQQGPVKTALRGSGSFDVFWLGAGLLLLLSVRLRGRSSARQVKKWAPVVVFLFVPSVAKAHFHDCVPDDRLNFEEVHCWYGGIFFGRSQLSPEVEGSGWNLHDEGDSSLGLLAGYQFLPNWFAELAYHDLGEVRFDTGSGSTGDLPSLGYRVPSLMIGYNLRDPSRMFNTFFKAGFAKISNKSPEGLVDYDAESSAQLALGAGVQFSFNAHWHVRVEAYSFDQDARVFGLTLVRRGGFMSPLHGSHF